MELIYKATKIDNTIVWNSQPYIGQASKPYTKNFNSYSISYYKKGHIILFLSKKTIITNKVSGRVENLVGHIIHIKLWGNQNKLLFYSGHC